MGWGTSLFRKNQCPVRGCARAQCLWDYTLPTMTLDPTTARRRATVRLLQKAQHAVPAFVLVGHGMAALREGAHGWHLVLALAEVAVSAAVFVAFARAIRDHRASWLEPTIALLFVSTKNKWK